MGVEELPVISDGLRLVGHLATPRGRRSMGRPALVLTHGLPPATASASDAGQDLPELADRIATTHGWVVLALRLRGAGGSEGNFSLGGWRNDIGSGLATLSARADVSHVWLAGFGTGGALSICAGADYPEVAGVAAMAAPADFEDWASQHRRLVQHARDIGLISSAAYPSQPDSWMREIRQIRPIAAAERLAPRPLLVMHGAEDAEVPAFDARLLADAHPGSELRIIGGASHQLRHDPRAISVLTGWLDRQANEEKVVVG